MRQVMRYRDEAVLGYRNAGDLGVGRGNEFGGDPITVCALVLLRYVLAVGGTEV